MFDRIMVALDGSDHADHALEAALAMAKRCEASVLLFHALAPHPLPGDLSRLADTAAREMYRRLGAEAAEKILDSAEQRARAAGVASVDRIAAEGNPAPAIVETAKRERIDVIVVGTRGLTGLKELALGSVARNVTAMAGCPVLVVK